MLELGEAQGILCDAEAQVPGVSPTQQQPWPEKNQEDVINE